MASKGDETTKYPDVEEEFLKVLEGLGVKTPQVVAKYVYDTGDVNGTRQLVAAFLFTPRSRQRAGCLRLITEVMGCTNQATVQPETFWTIVRW